MNSKTLIRNFIERNKSVFYIGFFTFLLFVILIAVSEIRRMSDKTLKSRLIEVEESTESITAKYELEATKYLGSTNSTKETTTSYVVLPESEYTEIDLKYGTVVIEYTNEGFTPTNAKALMNQKVKWLNKSENDIYIAQQTQVYQQFEKPVLIPANGFTEFRMYKDGLWKYVEKTSDLSGTINVIKP